MFTNSVLIDAILPQIDNKTKALFPVARMLCQNYFKSETQYDPLSDLVIIGSQLGIISA